jgi:hypothetical protein
LPKHEITDDFLAVYNEWDAKRITAVEAMNRLGMKPNTFYRRVREIEPRIPAEAGSRVYKTRNPTNRRNKR